MKDKVTRIRYKKDGMTLLSPILLGGSELYQAVIDLPAFSYTVKKSDGSVVLTESFKTMHEAMKAVKKSLKALGVKFDDEVRQKVVSNVAATSETTVNPS